MSDTVPTKTVKGMAIPLLPENYAFVMNIKRLIGATSYKFDRYHELRKATGDEIEFIREVVSKYTPDIPGLYTALWEAPWPIPRGVIIEYLNEPDWRYYVVTGLAGISDLGDAFSLAPVELEVGFSAIYLDTRASGPGWSIHAGRFFHVLEHANTDDSFFVDISGEEIETIRQIYAHLQQPDDRLTNVKRMARELGQLKGLPHRSPLRFLEYFAILESLLTHAPNPKDPYDSITRQVKKKLILLDHRWSHRIDYSPFGEAKPETVWKTMYDYRSLIAHGDAPDFTGKLSLLKDEETALKLIKETAKAVIRQALSEPQLLLDLRDC